MTENSALAAPIREYMAELDQVVDRAVRFGESAAKTGDEAYWDAVALNLQSFYSGVERIAVSSPSSRRPDTALSRLKPGFESP